MHLVVLTHPSLFWVVCRPEEHFPQKSLSENPRIGSPFLPSTRPYLLLPLGLVRAPLSCVSKACLLLMHLPWLGGSFVRSAAHYWLLMAWTGFWSFILYGLLPSWASPCLIVGFSLLNPLFAPSVGLLVFLPCHPIIPVVVLFDLCLLGLLYAFLLGLLYAFLSLNYDDPVLSLGLYLCYFGLS